MSVTRFRSSEAPVVILPEGDLLRDPARQQDLHVVDQLLARLQVAVLLRQVERVAERLAARDDRHLLHLVHGGQELGHQRVSGLVPGDDALLVGGDHLPRLQARHHPLEGVLEVGLGDEVAAAAAGEDRRLVAEVGQVRAGEPRGVARDPLHVHVLGQRLVARVDAEDPLAPAHVGRRHEDLAVEPPRPQQRACRASRACSRPPSRSRCRASRSRPSRPGAGSASGRARRRCRSRAAPRPRRARR